MTNNSSAHDPTRGDMKSYKCYKFMDKFGDANQN